MKIFQSWSGTTDFIQFARPMKLFQSSHLKTKPQFQLILVAMGTIDLAMIISDKISLSEFAGTHIEYLFLSVLLWMIMLMNL